MKNFLKKILGFSVFLSLLFPVLLVNAQSDVFNTLDIIEGKLQEDDLKVIDYSRSKWGSLDEGNAFHQEVIEILKSVGSNLTQVENAILNDKPEGEKQILRSDIELLAKDFFNENITETNEVMPTLYEQLSEAEGIAIALSSSYDSMPPVEQLKSKVDIYIRDVANTILGELSRKGESQINRILLEVAKTIRNVVGSLAVIWIVISGMRMVVASGDETKITEQKTSITYAIVGLVAILLLERIINIIYGVPGAERGIEIADIGQRFSAEIEGVISFIKAFIGSVAILMIVVSGVRTVAAGGEEEQITKQRKAAIWVIAGIVLILVNQVVIENIFISPSVQEISDRIGYCVSDGDCQTNIGQRCEEVTVIAADGSERERGQCLPFTPAQERSITMNNVTNIIGEIGRITNFLLGFVGLLAFGALVYGGGLMVANYGNDELVEKSKKIVKNALIGIIIIISAFALINTLIL